MWGVYRFGDKLQRPSLFEDMVIDPAKYPWGYRLPMIRHGSIINRLFFDNASYVQLDGPVLPEYGDFLFEILVNVPEDADRSVCFSQGDTPGQNMLWVSAHTDAAEATGHTRVMVDSGGNLGGSDIRGAGDVVVGLEREGNTLRLYEDGVLKDSNTDAGYQISQAGARIGVRSDELSRYMFGHIAYVSVKQDGKFLHLLPMEEASGDSISCSASDLIGAIEGAVWNVGIDNVGYCFEGSTYQGSLDGWGADVAFAWDSVTSGNVARSIGIRLIEENKSLEFKLQNRETGSIRISPEDIKVHYSDDNVEWTNLTSGVSVDVDETGTYAVVTVTIDADIAKKYWKFSCDAPDTSWTFAVNSAYAESIKGATFAPVS